MRAIWSGSIAFGLVNIPIKLYSATGRSDLDFDMLDKEHMSPIRYARISKETGEEVPYDQIVKGFQIDEGEYVVVEKQDFEKATPEKTDTIDIIEFVDEKEIDPIYFDKPYYLEPDKKAGRPYLLLRDALKETGKVGIAKFMMRTRPRIGVIKPYGEVIVLNQIRFQEEIRKTDELDVPSSSKPNKKELEMAVNLIDQMTDDFDLAEYKDTYVDELRKIIEAKAKGKKPAKASKKTEPQKVKDLMSALRASLQSEGDRKPRKRTRSKSRSS